MDLRQLHYFDAVARRRSFTQAALDLNIAQSALSQQVRKLEQELGVELLRRTTRRVDLTDAGELVLLRAGRMFAEEEALRADLDAMRGLLRGRLAIGGVPPVGALQPTRLIAEFGRQHPGVSIRVREDVAAALIDELRSDELDLVLALVDPEEVPDGVEARRLLEEELLLIMAADHPLAKRKRVPLTTLAGHALIAYGPGSALRDALVRALGPDAHFALEVNELETVRELAGLGMGVTLMPRAVAERHRGPLALRPVSPRLVVPVSLLVREGRRLSPAAAAFREHILTTVSNSPG
jgi:DNA-binding transcriptional LysR family regulator